MNIAYLPSPTRNVWDLGPIPIRAYAVFIIIGVVAAVLIADRRWQARGGSKGMAADMAVWAVPFGLVGARLYHVATDPELYFDPGRHPIDALKIWDGGLGIWGAVFLGAVGVWIGVRRRGARFAAFADAAAPGIAVAQGIGRLGNWFNNELYGGATTKPWGLTIHDIDPSTHRSTGVIGHFQPTFLYELIWDLGTAGVVVWADKRFRLGRGRVFALYVMVYVSGRAWIEYLRTDPANHVLGLRLNVWTCAIVFVLSLGYLVCRRGPREEWVERRTADVAGGDASADAPTEIVSADEVRARAGADTGPDRPGAVSNEPVTEVFDPAAGTRADGTDSTAGAGADSNPDNNTDADRNADGEGERGGGARAWRPSSGAH